MSHRYSRRGTAFALVAALLAAQTPSAFAQPPSGDPVAAKTLWLKGNGLKLKTSIYESSKLSSHPVLVVVLHGDLAGLLMVPPMTYEYVFAAQAARSIDDVVVAAVLRPGYRDHSGERSEGDAGLGTGDNYTADVVDAVAGVIEQLKSQFHPAHVVLAGHSGGAAITGDLVGRRPSVVDGAFLASCPCDLAAWRKHMMHQQDNNPIWSRAIHALSPQELAENVSPSMHVAVLVGAEDSVAPPSMSSHYAETLKKRLDHVTLTIAPGLGHDIFLEPVAYATLKSLVASLRQTEPR
jgi:pimeloyl-ACP methyl ester carboxylesterase